MSSTPLDRPPWLPYEEFPFGSRAVEVDGHRIHYVDEGTGPTLLLVHAGPAWSVVFRYLVDQLRGDFRCVAFDLPGSGMSLAAPGYQPGIEAAAHVLEQFVLALDLGDVTLVCHDIGGPVGLGFAARRPDHVRAIAVLESFGWSLTDHAPRVARMLRLVGGQTFGAMNAATNVLAWSTSSPLVGRLMRAPRRFSRSAQVAFLGPFHDRTVRRIATTMLGDAARGDTYLRAVDAALRGSLSDRPMLLVFGERSPVRSTFVPLWQERFPDARTIIVPRGHHFPMLDDPHLVASSLREWWHDLVGGRPRLHDGGSTIDPV